MKKISILLIALLWISGLTILIIALTNVVPDNPFKEYRLVIALSFIVFTRLLGKTYNYILKK